MINVSWGATSIRRQQSGGAASGSERATANRHTVTLINLDKCDKCSLLHKATQSNQWLVVDFVLGNRDIFEFDINRQNQEGKTALHLAGDNENGAIFQRLMEEGVDPEIMDSRGVIPFLRTTSAGETPLPGMEKPVQAELPLKPIRLDDCQKCSLLHESIEANQLPFVRFLLEHQDIFTFDINRQNSSGDTALHVAAFNGNNTIVEMLIERGIELDITNHNSGYTPVHMTMMTHQTQPSTLKLLLKAGCRINETGFTLLHHAASAHCPSSLKILLPRIVNREVKDTSGDTPLLSCLRYYYVRDYHDKKGALEILLKAGVNVEARNVEGASVLHVLINNSGTEDDIRQMLKYGADVNAFNTGEQTTPLQTVIKALTGFSLEAGSNEHDFCQLLSSALLLLNAGVDIDSKAKLIDESRISIRTVFSSGVLENKLEEKIRSVQFTDNTLKELALFINRIKNVEAAPLPLPLLILCRHTVRSHIRKLANGNSKVFLNCTEGLPLPVRLKKFIQCQPVEVTVSRDQ